MSTKKTTAELQQTINAMSIDGVRFPIPGPLRWLVKADGETVLQQGWFVPQPSAGPIIWLDVPTDVEAKEGEG